MAKLSASSGFYGAVQYVADQKLKVLKNNCSICVHVGKGQGYGGSPVY